MKERGQKEKLRAIALSLLSRLEGKDRCPYLQGLEEVLSEDFLSEDDLVKVIWDLHKRVESQKALHQALRKPLKRGFSRKDPSIAWILKPERAQDYFGR